MQFSQLLSAKQIYNYTTTNYTTIIYYTTNYTKNGNTLKMEIFYT